jgi:hypothetical protein
MAKAEPRRIQQHFRQIAGHILSIELYMLEVKYMTAL